VIMWLLLLLLFMFYHQRCDTSACSQNLLQDFCVKNSARDLDTATGGEQKDGTRALADFLRMNVGDQTLLLCGSCGVKLTNEVQRKSSDGAGGQRESGHNQYHKIQKNAVQTESMNTKLHQKKLQITIILKSSAENFVD